MILINGHQREKICLRLPVMSDSKQSAHLPRLARIMNFVGNKFINYTFNTVNYKGADRNVLMHKPVCVIVVHGMQLYIGPIPFH